LVCFTPKKLLRYPSCVSSVKDFTTGGFLEVIDDATATAKSTKKVVFCSGKLYYDLIEAKTKNAADDIAIVRLEQLYPFPIKQINLILDKYKGAAEYIWAQEEPENMGAWAHVMRMFTKYPETENIRLKYIGRAENASPATGFSKSHAEQQQAIIDKVVTVKQLAVK
jgi:2-oxoglutarate dehydrogenase E1 component